MKVPFKPLSLAAAVAAASIGSAGIVNAQSQASLAANEGLGDLAIIPYYTVNKSYSTGVDVINSSDKTQVIKIRLRRAADSMDALDFNVVLSPQDVWTGYIQKAADSEEIRFYSNDKSCTVPAFSVEDPEINYFIMPAIYRLGAESGYIEVLGMGATFNETQPIAVDAKHNASGVPKDCARVRDNFFKAPTPSGYYLTTAEALAAGRTRGVINSAITHQYTSATNLAPRPSSYTDTANVLKVSYFIKSDESGNEFGGNAVHIANFMNGASITNQAVGVNEGDLQGFDHPDLNGGAPATASSNVINLVDIGGIVVTEPRAAAVGSYESLRGALGASQVINDWSANETDLFTVATDWVVTTPGQYLMTNLPAYINSIKTGSTLKCLSGDPALAYNSTTGANCDFRDIPMELTAVVYDREELGIEFEEDDLVISPQPPGEIVRNVLNQEVNVLRWSESILGAQNNALIPVPEGANAGWASVSVIPNEQERGICTYNALSAAAANKPTTALPVGVACTSTSSAPPLVGFAAWERAFTVNPDANYGRIIDHSYN